MTPDRLNRHLLKIEESLGGTGEWPPAQLEDKLHWHLLKIEELLNSGGGGGGKISFIIVDKLPETGESNVVYLVPKKTIFSKNKYDEYVWIEDDSDFEYIGTGAFDPTGYATVEYVDEKLLEKQNKLEFNVEVPAGQGITITSIKDGDNYYVIPSSGSTVDWSDVTNKPEFAEVSFSGDYTDLENKPDLSIYAQSADLATVATSGSYADLSNTPLSSISISQTTTPGTASHPASATTTITLDGTSTTIDTFTVIDTALSSSSKNPVANNVIYNAISNKVDAEDFQELEQIALTTNGILSGTPLVPILSITDGVYYPTVSDSGKRWKMGKADSPTFYKIYDVSQYTSVHLKSVSRAGHILTDTAPSDFNISMHQESPATWYEATSVSDSEQADVLPKTGYTPYDKDLTTNGRHYLIVYEVNAAQAIEVINGGGYSPIYTSMFVNNGDGTTQNDPYAKVSQLSPIPVCPATTDGAYILQATVSGGQVVYEWILK